MTAYLAWWFGGGAVGMAAAAWILRRRNAMNDAVGVAFAAAAFGCLYGAKVQYRLGFEPAWDALAVSPGELLTPGFHIPLGLVVGFAAAMLVARLLRAEALRVADALALASAVMMPIGRIGCMVAGCCTGSVCPSWWPFGVTRAPASTAYAEQLSAGLIQPDAAASLPVHPLPVYFAALGIVTAAVQLRLFRRNARPGAVAAVGFLLYPLGQLAIERLRTPSENRGPIMTAVLVGMIACNVTVVLGIRWRDRVSRSRAAANDGPLMVNDAPAPLIDRSCSTGPGAARGATTGPPLAPSVADLAPDLPLVMAEVRR